MKIGPILAALLLAVVLSGCKSDREVITGTPPPATNTSPATPDTSASTSSPAGPSAKDPGFARVAESKFQSTPSGVKYAILKEGKGEGIKTHQEAVVHYTGWLENGTKFDSSRDRGEPYPVVIDESQVIQGWHDGIKGMKVGEQRQLRIPPALGYGESGRAPIPPNATLIFEIELVEIGQHSH